MPTYEYRCDKCLEVFEVVQSFNDRPLRRHRDCGGPLEKVFHPRGVVFKGSGFYSTDSRPKPKSDTSNKSTDKSDKSSDKSERPIKADKAEKAKTPAASTASDSSD
jgi:putative FmdB family regulatory protein